METAHPPRVSMRGIVKRFDGVVALAGVDLEISPGEVHAIVGENGAGKSTLIKILTGVYTADEGTITVEGTESSFRRPADALAAGIATIHQEIHLVPTMSAVENVFLGREPKRRFGLIDRPAMRRATEELLATYRVPVSPDVPIGELGVAAQQMIAIIRALSLGGRVLVMDEPTSALTHNEVEALLAIVRRLRAEGVAVLYISHRLDEIFDVGDRVTVLRDGQRVRTERIADIDRRTLVESMLGRPAAAVRPTRTHGSVTAAAPLVAANLAAEPRIHDASATVGRGEIVGLAGLQGSGRTEFMRLVFGADRAGSGTVDMGAGARSPTSPADSLHAGLAYLPEDRKADGIVPDLSVRENLTLVVLPALARLGIVRPGAERELVETFIARLGIKTASQDIPIRSLSGGNQQKVLIARLLCSQPAFLLLDDPMRGIDIGAKAEIARLIASLADGGLGVLMTSSELEEVTSAADRVVVMRDGRTTGEFSGDDVRFEAIAAAIAGDRQAGAEAR